MEIKNYFDILLNEMSSNPVPASEKLRFQSEKELNLLK